MNQNEMIFCRACGKQMHQTVFACPSCGAPSSPEEGKSKTAATLLAFFLGGFGGHRFYLGQWWGVFYLMFSFTLIPFFIAFIEFIVLLCTSKESWDAKYGAGQYKGSSAGVMAVVIVVGLVVDVFMIGVLAAISLPAYQDYTTRSRIVEALVAAEPVSMAVGNYYLANKQLPPDLKAVGVDATQLSRQIRNIELNPDDGVLTIYINVPAGNDSSVILTPEVDAQGKIVWACSSATIRNRWLPSQCRKG